MITYLARALGTTAVHRARAGALFPGWSFAFEAFTRVLKIRARALAGRALSARRADQDRAGDREARRFRHKVDRSKQTLAGVEGEWFAPRGRRPRRTILYFHGGGFIEGSSRTHAEWLMRLALEADARVFAPNFRLAPEHRFPTQNEEARAVYLALLEGGVPPGELTVMGDSAGGTLTLTLLMALRDEGRPLPARAVLLSPWVDVAARSGSMRTNSRYDWAEPEDFDTWVRAWVPEGADLRDPRISPLFGDLRGLPPLWVEVGTAEMLLDQVRAFADRARAQGAELFYRELPGMVHNSFLLAAYFPRCKAAVDELVAWLRRDGAATPA